MPAELFCVATACFESHIRPSPTLLTQQHLMWALTDRLTDWPTERLTDWPTDCRLND